MAFKDLFSGHAADYARFRPTYPPELFAWLAGISPGRDLAVDAGTGSGQAAIGLAAHFEQVIGIDPSAEQVEHARPHPAVEYRVAAAEDTGLEDASVDLLLAAQAFHWFAADPFFAEVRRILRPHGVLVLAAYELSRITPKVDRVVDDLYRSLGPYWEPERRLVEEGYAGVAVPFPEVSTPRFAMRTSWSMLEFAGYLGTWSALRRCVETTGISPLETAVPALADAWGSVAAREVTWPLAVRAFRLS